MTSSRMLLLAILAALLPAYGCQVISASITSPSDSISGTGKAIGGSSQAVSMSSGSGGDSDDKSKPSYERDLREYTASFVRAGAKPDQFKTGVTRIAASHGISNWEADSKTPDAIGAGLGSAQQSEAQARAFCSDQAFPASFTNEVMSAWKSAR